MWMEKHLQEKALPRVIVDSNGYGSGASVGYQYMSNFQYQKSDSGIANYANGQIQNGQKYEICENSATTGVNGTYDYDAMNGAVLADSGINTMTAGINATAYEQNGMYDNAMNHIRSINSAEGSYKTYKGGNEANGFDYASSGLSNNSATEGTNYQYDQADVVQNGQEAGAYFARSSSFGDCSVYDSASNANVSSVTANQLPLSRYRLQYDVNPTIVRKPLNTGPLVYRQNVNIRFLRPPPPPAPGPLIIKEIRPPQLPPAPPVVIRQRPPIPATPPPLVLREKPPKPPAPLGPQVITKRLPALPPPPRQVVIERYPPLPPKPRDIIIERWLPYGPMPKRRIIYQKAAACKSYQTAKNMIIYYEQPRPQIQRVFRKYGIVQAEPRLYVEKYGRMLLDTSSLVSQARQAGVMEDISAGAIQSSQNITFDNSYAIERNGFVDSNEASNFYNDYNVYDLNDSYIKEYCENNGSGFFQNNVGPLNNVTHELLTGKSEVNSLENGVFIEPESIINDVEYGSSSYVQSSEQQVAFSQNSLKTTENIGIHAGKCSEVNEISQDMRMAYTGNDGKLFI